LNLDILGETVGYDTPLDFTITGDFALPLEDGLTIDLSGILYFDAYG